MFRNGIRRFTKAAIEAGVRSLLRNSSGSVAIGAAIAFPAMCLAVGCAVDIGRQINLKNHAQIALDDALLAAVSTPDEADKTVNAWLAKNGQPNFKLVELKSSSGSDELEMEASAVASIPASFMSMFGVENLKVNVESTVRAPLSLEEVDIEIKQAYGYSNKVVRAMVKRLDGKVEPILTLTYTMTSAKGANWRGTGTTKVVPSGQVSTGKYSKLWFEMDVTEYDTRKTFTYSTDDPKTANHLYVDGKMLPAGSKVSLNELVTCGSKPKIHEWEDSRSKKEWGVQDIEIVVKGKCSDTQVTAVRITR